MVRETDFELIVVGRYNSGYCGERAEGNKALGL